MKKNCIQLFLLLQCIPLLQCMEIITPPSIEKKSIPFRQQTSYTWQTKRRSNYKKSVAAIQPSYYITQKVLTLLVTNSSNFVTTPKNVRLWVVPISLINKKFYALLNEPHTIRSLISSISYKTEEFTEGELALVLNTPGARKYASLSNQLFNPKLSHEDRKKLITQGADVNYRQITSFSYSTPLLYFIYRELPTHVESLLALNADISHYSGIDPIHASVRQPKATILRMLLEYKPATFDLYTPLTQLIRRYCSQTARRTHLRQARLQIMINMLLDHGADATDTLIYMIENELFDTLIITTLIKTYKANPNKAFLLLSHSVSTQDNKMYPYYKSIIAILKKSPLFKQKTIQIAFNNLSKIEANTIQLKQMMLK